MLEIRNLTRQQLPRLPLEKIVERVLGKEYSLSLVLCSSTLSRRLNRERRNKDKAANVLSFSLEEKIGEVFIDITLARKEGLRDGITVAKRIGILFIHGCAHLNGLDHGGRMDALEQTLAQEFLCVQNLQQASMSAHE